MTNDRNATKELGEFLVTSRTLFRMLLIHDPVDGSNVRFYGPGFTGNMNYQDWVSMGSPRSVDCLVAADESAEDVPQHGQGGRKRSGPPCRADPTS